MARSVLILAECAPRFGMGHLSRSLVLARALRARGAIVRFALTTADALALTGDFPATTADKAAPAADLLIVDGYRIGTQAIVPFRAAAGRTALIDDTADRPRPCDAVVNFQFYADACDYSAYPPGARILGPRYAPIRPDFHALRTRNSRTVPRVAMSFGGGATGAFGLMAARALAARFAGPIDLALGALGPDAMADLPETVTAGVLDMTTVMGAATLYAGSLGTTFLEALAAGLPCVCARVTEDQGLVVAAARALGAPVLETPDPDALADLILAALADPAAPPSPPPEFPDGDGANRLADALLALR